MSLYVTSLIACCLLLTSAHSFILHGFKIPTAAPFVTSLGAKHVQKKATKGHEHDRPKKSRLSDKFRKPVEYPDLPPAPEAYTVETVGTGDAPPVTRGGYE